METFQVVSDVHLEAYARDKPLTDIISVEADNLILAGDICSQPIRLLKELKLACDRYDKVIFVPGNHEYYNTSYETVRDELYDLELLWDNLHVFDEYSRLQIGDIHVHGCTLWGHIEPEDMFDNTRMINDYHRIMIDGQIMTCQKMNELNERQASALYNGIQNGKKNLVVTHHVPSLSLVDPIYANSPCNGSFASEQLKTIQEKDIAVWVYGHSHGRLDIEVADTRIIQNCFGYPGELKSYTEKVFEI